jgi:hypothetical protein
VVCYSLGMSENETPTYRRPAAVATTVLVLGTAASLAINAKAISLTPNPEGGAYVSGLAWPLALLLVIELMIHTPWMSNKRDAWTKGAALVIVGGVAAWISYWHGVHVLAHWSYDEVGQHAGPLVADVAMAVATLALNRIGHAKRMAKNVAVATVATPPAPVATVASAEDVATADLANDWAGLEDEVAAYVAAEQARPVSAPPAIETAETTAPEPAEEPAQTAATTTLTKVPAEAAKRIQAALEANPKATAVSIAADLVEAGLADSPRSGRRYVAAVKNGTARLA